MNTTRLLKVYRKAQGLAQDESALQQLSLQAIQKAEHHKGRVKAFLKDLLAMIRMVRAWAKKEYRVMPWTSFVAAVGALAYFLNPLDFVPDFLLVGFVDDALVVAWVLSSIKKDLDVFLNWEKLKEGGEL